MAPLSPLFPLFLLPLERQADMRKLSPFVPIEARKAYVCQDFALALDVLDSWPDRYYYRGSYVELKALCLILSEDFERAKAWLEFEVYDFPIYYQALSELLRLIEPRELLEERQRTAKNRKKKAAKVRARARKREVIARALEEQQSGTEEALFESERLTWKNLAIVGENILDEQEIMVKQFLAEGRFDIAENLAKQLVSDHPGWHQYWHCLSKVYFAAGRYPEALREIKFVLRFAKTARNYFFLALVLSSLNRNKEAIWAIGEAIKDDSQPQRRYFYLLSQLLYRLKDYQWAGKAIKRALAEIDRNYDRNRNLLVRILLAAGRLDEALPLARENVQLFGQERDRFWLAKCEQAALLANPSLMPVARPAGRVKVDEARRARVKKRFSVKR
jgi:tetratricopeptide (TPR) repeat protein